jgi:2-polyprenyl-3-methyl-5-hydroxy-6-metoxy-1,4-benzoquinol methylase
LTFGGLPTHRMGDFRDRVYDRYLSSLGDSAARREKPGGRGFQAWCEENYLPLVAHLPRDARILELGCGAGELLDFLRQQGFTKAEGVDLSPEYVASAQRKGLSARVVDAREALLKADPGLDCVIAIEFVEHFSMEELLDLLHQVMVKLRPGGRLILRTPNGGALLGGHSIYSDVTHVTIFSPASLYQTLRLAGFDEITIRDCPPAHGTLAGRVRALLWGAIATGAGLVHRIETGKKQSIWTESMLCACRKRCPVR